MQTTAPKPLDERTAPDDPQTFARQSVELPISKKKHPWWLYLLLLIGAGAYAYWWFYVPKLTAEVTPVERGNASAAVYGTVTVEPVSTVMIRPQLQGTLKNFNLEKGDRVEEGQILAEVDDPDLANKLKNAELNLRKTEKLMELGPPSQASLDAKRLLVSQLQTLVQGENIPRAELEKNTAELKTLEAKVVEETLTLEGEVEKAKFELQLAKNGERKRIISAPLSGVVLELFSELGEVANPKSNLFAIGSHALQLRVGVNEEDVGDLKAGMKGTVQLYSYPGREFSAEVKSVVPLGVNQEYNIIMTLQTPPEGLMPGMTGEANIDIGDRKDVLVIPTRAVRGSMRMPFVRVVNKNGRVENKRIKVGYRSMELTEVTDGVKEGDLVILYDQDRFAPGVKVQTHVVPASVFMEPDL